MPIEVAKLRDERDEALRREQALLSTYDEERKALVALSTERGARKRAERDLAALRKAADALAFANARLLQRVRETSADKWMPHAVDAAEAALAAYRATKEGETDG